MTEITDTDDFSKVIIALNVTRDRIVAALKCPSETVPWRDEEKLCLLMISYKAIFLVEKYVLSVKW